MYWITNNIPELVAMQDSTTKIDIKRRAIINASSSVKIMFCAVMFSSLMLVTMINAFIGFIPTMTELLLQNLVSMTLQYSMIALPFRNKIIRREVKRLL